MTPLRRFGQTTPGLGRAFRAQCCQCRASSTTATAATTSSSPPARHSTRPTRDDVKASFARIADKSLQQDEYGASLTLDPENKTIATAVGDLPISPVMDPGWMEARDRFKRNKPRGSKMKDIKDDPFRDQLYRNSFALALASPYRYCVVTDSGMPRDLLQSFEMVSSPETNEPWLLPAEDPDVQRVEKKRKQQDAPAATEETPKQDPTKYRPSAPTGYTLARKDLIEGMGLPRQKTPLGQGHMLMFSRRKTVAMSGVLPNLGWREDMHEVLLGMMRKRIVDRLLHLAQVDRDTGRDYVRSCEGWHVINKDMDLKGCVMWLPKQEGEASPEGAGLYATLDIQGGEYAMKVPVHNLQLLLGDEHLARLREDELFRTQSLFVLGRTRTLKVQEWLWKLQGYLAADIDLQVHNGGRGHGGEDRREQSREDEPEDTEEFTDQ